MNATTARRPPPSRTPSRRTPRIEGRERLGLTLLQSQLYLDYQAAFRDATGLPLVLRLAFPCLGQSETPPPPPPALCQALAKVEPSCGRCLDPEPEAFPDAPPEVRTDVCRGGFRHAAVPVRLGEDLVGWLHTGPVALAKPDPARLQRLLEALQRTGGAIDPAELRRAYFQTPVYGPARYQALLTMLDIFAQHLSLLANQLALQERPAESPTMRRALAFIAARHAEPITLSQTARAAGLSVYYFCKAFKKATGYTFTDYLCRVRVEKAKELLLNPNLRISEVAFDAGFQSITHFNRIFRAVAGCSPSACRAAQGAH